MLQLTEHFTLEELYQSDTAVRLGIDNAPPSDVIPHLVVLAKWLEEVRVVLGRRPVHVSSGYRSEALERVLCEKDYGAWCRLHSLMPSETSWRTYFERKGHPRGYCGDFTCPTFGSPREIVVAVRDSGLAFDQLIEEGTWCHGSADPRQRRQVLTARFNEKGEPIYTQGVA